MKKFIKVITSIVGGLTLIAGVLAFLDRFFYHNSKNYEYVSCQQDDE